MTPSTSGSRLLDHTAYVEAGLARQISLCAAADAADPWGADSDPAS